MGNIVSRDTHCEVNTAEFESAEPYLWAGSRYGVEGADVRYQRRAISCGDVGLTNVIDEYSLHTFIDDTSIKKTV